MTFTNGDCAKLKSTGSSRNRYRVKKHSFAWDSFSSPRRIPSKKIWLVGSLILDKYPHHSCATAEDSHSISTGFSAQARIAKKQRQRKNG
jgi:hypothetical protein